MAKGKNNLKNQVKFSKTNQPAPERKSAGWKKKRTGKELALFILQQRFHGAKDSKLKKLACEYFQCDEQYLTNEMMILMRTVEKAIQKIDSAAAKILLERAHGLPKQEIEHLGDHTYELTMNINRPTPTDEA